MASVALTYKQTADTGKTKTWDVIGPTGTRLGYISWWSQWRRYVFHPAPDTLYDADCLGSITGFIMVRMKERK